MNTPALGTEPVQQLTFTVQGGEQRAPGLYQWSTVLRLDASSGRAAMAIDRHNGDLLGRPIGLFGGDGIASHELTAAIEHTAWADLPQPDRGDVAAPTLGLDYLHGTLLIQRRFNARNLQFLQAIAPIMQPLRELMAQLLERPERALQVEAQARVQHDSATFTLILHNVGDGPLLVSDPRHGHASAWLQVAELAPTEPGTTEIPPTWTRIAASDTPGERRALLLAAGQRVAMESIEWPLPKAGGNFLLQAVFEDYLGPPVEPAKVLPFSPAPAEIDARPYVVRGAAFSSYQRFHAEPAGQRQ